MIWLIIITALIGWYLWGLFGAVVVTLLVVIAVNVIGIARAQVENEPGPH